MVEIVTICEVKSIEKYPFAKILRFSGKEYQVVMTSNASYAVGEEVLYFSDGSVLPPPLLKYMNLWNKEENKGRLYGNEGNIIRPYYLNKDPDYYSYGMVLKMPQDGRLRVGHTDIDLRASKNLTKDLRVTQIGKGLPYYYRTALFLADINYEQPVIQDIETVPTLFDDEAEIYADRLITGRTFYITVSSKITEPQAFGMKHNVFITTQGLKKYVYFSATQERRIYTNLFIKVFLKSRVLDMMNAMVQAPQAKGTFTCEIIQDLQGFSKDVEAQAVPNRMVLVDAYYGIEPFGRHLTRSALNVMARRCQVRTLENVYEGPFNYKDLCELAEQEQYGFVLRNENYTKRAYLFSREYRIRRCRPKHK